MAVILAHPGDSSLVDYQHYVWANMFQFLGAQVATIPLKSVCSIALHDNRGYGIQDYNVSLFKTLGGHCGKKYSNQKKYSETCVLRPL